MDQNLSFTETSLFPFILQPPWTVMLGFCIMVLMVCFLFFADIINGVQEKCVLPPMDGYPHCEGKIKVK